MEFDIDAEIVPPDPEGGRQQFQELFVRAAEHVECLSTRQWPPVENLVGQRVPSMGRSGSGRFGIMHFWRLDHEGKVVVPLSIGVAPRVARGERLALSWHRAACSAE